MFVLGMNVPRLIDKKHILRYQ